MSPMKSASHGSDICYNSTVDAGDRVDDIVREARDSTVDPSGRSKQFA